jgi:hypothetical protein
MATLSRAAATEEETPSKAHRHCQAQLSEGASESTLRALQTVSINVGTVDIADTHWHCLLANCGWRTTLTIRPRTRLLPAPTRLPMVSPIQPDRCPRCHWAVTSQMMTLSHQSSSDSVRLITREKYHGWRGSDGGGRCGRGPTLRGHR